jgi:hypothetical protein
MADAACVFNPEHSLTSTDLFQQYRIPRIPWLHKSAFVAWHFREFDSLAKGSQTKNSLHHHRAIQKAEREQGDCAL